MSTRQISSVFYDLHPLARPFCCCHRLMTPASVVVHCTCKYCHADGRLMYWLTFAARVLERMHLAAYVAACMLEYVFVFAYQGTLIPCCYCATRSGAIAVAPSDQHNGASLRDTGAMQGGTQTVARQCTSLHGRSHLTSPHWGHVLSLSLLWTSPPHGQAIVYCSDAMLLIHFCRCGPCVISKSLLRRMMMSVSPGASCVTLLREAEMSQVCVASYIAHACSITQASSHGALDPTHFQMQQ